MTKHLLTIALVCLLTAVVLVGQTTVFTYQAGRQATIWSPTAN
jgi:hypothetical protein